MITILALSIISSQNINYDYDDLLIEAYNCRNATEEAKDSGIIEKLIEIENFYFVSYDIPNELRGMLLAAACSESGYNPNAKGDWKASGKKYKTPRAKGILQFWQWAEKAYGLNRLDPIDSAHVWMRHLVSSYEKNRCKGYRLTKKQRWLAAWAQAVRGRLTKQNRYRCFQRTKHWKKLKKWKRNIKNNAPGC